MNNETNSLLPKLAVLDEKIAEAPQIYSLKFTMLPEGEFDFLPGQFNMLGLPGLGEAPISFSSLRLNEKSFIHTIRLAGNVTNAIFSLNLNDTLQIRGPFGRGWPLEKIGNKNLIIIAGGIGMAPLRPVIYHRLKKSPGELKTFLVYGVRNEEDLLFKKELNEWSQSGRINVLLSAQDKITGESGLSVYPGMITELFNQIDAPLNNSISFICGPELMMRFAAKQLILAGQHIGDIYVSMERRMKCGVAACGHCQIGVKYVCKDGPVFAYNDIKRFADTLL